jgi:hypothetical protein
VTNADMVEYWNGRPADVWVREAERFDTMLAPFGRQLLASAALQPGEQVLTWGAATAPSAWRPPELSGPAGK